METRRELKPIRNLVAAFGVFALADVAVFSASAYETPSLHTFFDSGIFVLSGVLAFLLWDMGWRAHDALARLLAVVFAATAIFELVHVLAAIELSADVLEAQRMAERLRPATWPPSSYLLPIGVGTAYLLRNRRARWTPAFATGLLLLGAGLVWLFDRVPRYTDPTWLGITRPSLVLVPVLWVAVALAYRRTWGQERIAECIFLFSILAFLSNAVMLYSQVPADHAAMLAHAGKFANRIFLLVTLMQMGTIDTARRMRAERDLGRLNEALETRVRERTVGLESAVSALRAEAATRERAEHRTLAQLARLHLLQQITHAIGERQDLDSIFQVVVGSLELHLPVDFSCLCRYDPVDRRLTVARVGTNTARLAGGLDLGERAQIEIDRNGLSRCVAGQLVYEPDLSVVDFPFPRRLARGGLRALVAVPLRTEKSSGVFGILLVARLEPESFSSGDCEFMDQLGENVALATNQAQLHTALQNAYDELRNTQQAVVQQERLRALGQMASGVAHDINNAISPASLYVESILTRDMTLADSTRSQLETVHRAIGDVSQTVARMGEFYRRNESQLTLAPVNVNVVIGQVPDLTRARWSDMAQAREVAIDVRVEAAPEVPTIMAIESELREALINLVFNAADAMPTGGTIVLRVRRTPGVAPFSKPAVLVEVIDNGIGMDDSTRTRCLEPFFTTKGERGSGLGLAMVYGIAQRHQAELQIDSEPGKGTTIRLLFSEYLSDLQAPAATRLEKPVRKLKILLIDDDPMILTSLRDALEFDGHEVTCAHGGQNGIDLFNAALDCAEPFPAVITDLGMPRVDGRKVAAAIRMRAPGTYLIMLTGWGQRLMESGDAPAHVDKILNKPPNMWQLRDALSHAGEDRD